MFEDIPTVSTKKQEIIDDLLKDLPSESAIEVNLPSENKIYALDDPGAPITLRPMTFEDEKQVISADKNQDPVNIILQRCITNLHVGELLISDKLYLIMKLREISYGDDYTTTIVCNGCKTENNTTIKLSQLRIEPVPSDLCDPLEVHLPSIGKMVKVRIPRVKDEKLFGGGDIYTNLWRFVEEIDGQFDKIIISAVLKKLPLRDMKLILKAMKTDFGVDTRIKFLCSECQETAVVELPINANFFDAN